MIDRVVRVLEVFKAEGEAMTASEIARQASIPMPSAHRIVGDLVQAGVLERDDQQRLRIGIKLWEIASRASSMLSLRELALPYMEDLHAVVKEATRLSILDRNDVLNVETLSSRETSATNVTQPGTRLPLLASSPGIVLVAFSPPEVSKALLASAKITRFTEYTIIDRDVLERVVEETRRNGFVIARRWIAPDAIGIAAPILGTDGSVVAALSVTQPFDAGDVPYVLPAVITTARGISRAVRAENRTNDPRLTRLKRQIRSVTEGS